MTETETTATTRQAMIGKVFKMPDPDPRNAPWRWPQHDFGEWGWGGCEVPYRIDASIATDSLEWESIAYALDFFNNYPGNGWCRWRNAQPSDTPIVVFRFDPSTGAQGEGNAYVGRHCTYANPPAPPAPPDLIEVCTAEQDINLNCDEVLNLFMDTCTTTVKHEMLHALGFRHEHQRADRDSYIDLREWTYGSSRYDILPEYEVYPLDFPYDLFSIMHYRSSCAWIPSPVPFFGFWQCNPWQGVVPKLPDIEFLPVDTGPTYAIGGLNLSDGDRISLNVVYPPPPGAPTPSPEDPCAGVSPSTCWHGSWHSECCGYLAAFDHTREWRATRLYQQGDTVQWNKASWRCLQAHTSQATWQPGAAPSLWVRLHNQGSAWHADTEYIANSIVRHQSALYVVIQPHRSAPGWEPPNVPSLWMPLSQH